MKNQLYVSECLHRQQSCLKLDFDYNSELIRRLKNTVDASWSQTLNAWYINNNSKFIEKLQSELLPLGVHVNLSKELEQEQALKQKPQLSLETEDKIKSYLYWMRSKRYSESTISTYTDALRTFLRFYPAKKVEEINNADIIRFNNEYILANKLSPSFQNQVVNSIKLFFKTIENKSIDIASVHRPKRAKVLPNVLSKEEVKLILGALRNVKHKAMLSLIYSCGLRRSELLNLKLTDVNSARGLLIIKQAKGRKDRVTPLSSKILPLLREYFVAYKPQEWLFEGQGGKGQYDESSLAAVLKRAVQQCGITKPVTLHWLRHSFATHLLENGTDLRYIQEMLGHSRSTITEIYTHVSNKNIQKIISPFDYL